MLENKPDCIECQKFDGETKELIEKLFSKDELTFFTVISVKAIHDQTAMLKELAKKEFKTEKETMFALRLNRDVDFAQQSVGKLLLGFDDIYKQTLKKQLASMGIELAVEHAPCPHKEKVTGPTTPEVA